MKLRIKPIVAACALAMVAGQAGAIDYYLAAKAYNKTMPDGSIVPMWGYVVDPDTAGDLDSDGRVEGDCFETTPATARVTCINNLPDPVGVVGPRLTIPPTDSTFRIFLTNGLSEPTSIVIPGQEMPHSATTGGQPDNGPTWNDGTRGPRGGDYDKKLRSYGREADADGGRRAFVWRDSRANPITETGTLIYHTGTLPQKQLYMGLYGLVTKDAAAGVVYDFDPNITGDEVGYSSDTTLFYSDIDPAFNAAVAAGTLTTAIDRHPSWFLINGEPYVPTTPDISGMATNQANLIRFASAATEKHVPVLQGLYGTIHGEDGIQYNWQDSAAGTATPAPIQQYSFGLPPLKTKDVIVNPSATGRYAIYDGNGYMTNPSDPDNPGVGDTTGGMLRFIDVAQGTNQSPVTVPDQLVINIPEGTTDPVSVDVAVLDNDFDPEGAALSLLASNNDFVGTNIDVNLTCPATADPLLCTATATPSTTDPWTSPVATDLPYTASDGDAGTPDTLGTVSITVVENLTPVLTDDALAADTLTPLNFNLYTDLVEPNDIDNEGDTLEVTAIDATTTLGVVDCPDLIAGDCTYTPPATLPGTIPFDELFTYTVSDGVNLANQPIATVTITVDVTGSAAVAVDDNYAAVDGALEDTLLQVAAPGVLSNDTSNGVDPLLGTETAVLVAGSGPENAAAFTLNADGSFEYTPLLNFNGQDSFQYLVNNGVDSLPATVTIDVEPVNDAPEFVDDSYVVTEDGVLDVAAPGVLANDNDIDNDPLTAVLLTAPSSALPGACPGAPAGPNCFVLNADGSFHYQPDVNFSGADSFTYEVSDGTVASGPVTVTIAVTPQNDAPLALNDTFYLTNATEITVDGEGQPLTATFDFPALGVLDNDVDDTALTATEVNDTDGVSPSVNSDGSTSATIEDNGVGVVATLEYTATDTTNLVSNIATAEYIRLVTITMAEFRLNEDNNPANDDWRIRGNVDTTVIPAGSQVNAFLVQSGSGNVIPIVPNVNNVNNTGVVLNNGAFRINVNNAGPRPATTGDFIRVEVLDENDNPIANATYGDMPVYILP